MTLDRRSSVQGCRLTLKHGSVVLPSLGETTTAWLGGVTHPTKKPGIKAYTLTNLWGNRRPPEMTQKIVIQNSGKILGQYLPRTVKTKEWSQL